MRTIKHGATPYNNRFNLNGLGRHAFRLRESRAGTPVLASFPGREHRANVRQVNRALYGLPKIGQDCLGSFRWGAPTGVPPPQEMSEVSAPFALPWATAGYRREPWETGRGDFAHERAKRKRCWNRWRSFGRHSPPVFRGAAFSTVPRTGEDRPHHRGPRPRNPDPPALLRAGGSAPCAPTLRIDRVVGT